MSPFLFSHDYVLEDDFVRLSPLTADDFDRLQHFSVHSAIWKLSSIRVEGADDFRNYMQLALDGRTRQEEYPFVVFDKRQQTYAGCTRFYDIQLSKQTLQLGYTWYGEDFQGTGLNRHCKFLLLGFAFEHMGMERVEFRADLRNQRSLAAMKRIGCTQEGILRSHFPMPDGHRRDSVILSILRHEWFGSVKQNLAGQL